MTSIEWTDTTWNPVRGCSRVSPGCDNCYAMGQAHRFTGPAVLDPSGDRSLDKPAGPYHGLTTIRRGKVDWSGRVRFVPEMLDAPLRWRKPRRVFVNSMSDLFHESLSNEQIAAVFGVMAACPQHTFQVLTKRARRMREWFGWVETGALDKCACHADDALAHVPRDQRAQWFSQGRGASVWPLPNVVLMVSAEDQQRADERIPDLLATPAAVRGVSGEPLLGDLDLSVYLRPHSCDEWPREQAGGPNGCAGHPMPALDWLIVGGESGRNARPCDVAWIRSIVEQCRAAGVACFVKQFGARPVFRSPLERFETFGPEGQSFGREHGAEMVVTGGLKHRKGADPSEWPAELRVRQFPEVRS